MELQENRIKKSFKKITLITIYFFFFLSLNILFKNCLVLKNGMKSKENVTLFYREIAKITLFCWLGVDLLLKNMF